MNERAIRYSGCMSLMMVVALGCSVGGEPSLADFNDSNIKKLRGAYGLFLVAHNLNGPESKEELLAYLTTNPTAIRKMEMMGIAKDAIPSIFMSDRDGKPFKVRYGLKGLDDHYIVFESEGVDGKRLVAHHTPVELEPDEYEAAWAGQLKGVGAMGALGEVGQ
ncbi:MAG: hypothetical protein AAGD11_11690 [Planctomycetota bacterium]